MEIRARYTLMGLFTLAVIAAGFGFTYWLNSAGGLGGRSYYRVSFDSPVAGLLRGSGVLFNGIRVGEVTGLKLDPTRPRVTTASIAVDRDAPVRADTRVTIEFQGLTGAPVIALIGGDANAPLLAAASGEAPVLIAEKDAGQGMGQAARDVLRHIDTVVTTNADPLRSLIGNIDKFAGALARNSDRVDGIVAGLERLTGGGSAKPKPLVFELAPARGMAPLARLPAGQLLVPEPVALAVFETEKILVRAATGEAPSLERGQWPDLLAKVVQARVIETFENGGYLKAMGRSAEAVKPDHQLLLEVRAFHIEAGDALSAEVEIAARVVDGDGKIVTAQVFSARQPVRALEPAAAAAALNLAFSTVAGQIVAWTCAAI